MATAKSKQPSAKATSGTPAKRKAASKKSASVKTTGKAAQAKKAASSTAPSKMTPAKKAAPKKAAPAAAKKAPAVKKALAVKKAPAGKKAPAAKKAPAVKKAAPVTKATAAKSKPAPAKKAAAKRIKPALEHIDDRTLGKIIEKLEEMRIESRKIVNSQLASDMQPREENKDVGDDLDQASDERDREFNLIMHQRHLRRLQQIADAYERIEDGSYGLCEGTDEPINPRRLLIMPLARYSLEYQEQQEKMLGRTSMSDGFQEADVSFGSED